MRDNDALLNYPEKSDNDFLQFSKEATKKMEEDSTAFLGLMSRIVAVMESQGKS